MADNVTYVNGDNATYVNSDSAIYHGRAPSGFGFDIPDPKWEEPNLLIPGKKPTGPVVIDWSHPLARGLRAFYLFNNPGLVDLVSGDRLTMGDSVGTPSLGASPQGQVLYFDGNADYVYEQSNRLFIPADLSLVCGVNQSTRSEVGSLIGYGADGEPLDTNYQYYFSVQTNGKLRLFWEYGSGTNVAVDSTTPSSSIGDYAVYGCSRETAATSSVSFYENGQHLNTSSGNTNPSGGTSSAAELRIGKSFLSTQDLNGYMNFMMVYDRTLSDEEHALIARNPYQFLIPA